MTSETMAEIPGGSLHLLDINPDDKSIQLVYHPDVRPLLATVELSTKPMINLVWIGFLTIVAGAVIAFFRRIGEGRK
jgi:hypothetical protein